MNESIRRLIDIDRLIHEPARLVIVMTLAAVVEADFLYLLHETGLSKGNLSTHLTRLEKAGYVEIEKGFVGKVSRTVCRLTVKGDMAFQTYRTQMRAVAE